MEPDACSVVNGGKEGLRDMLFLFLFAKEPSSWIQMLRFCVKMISCTTLYLLLGKSRPIRLKCLCNLRKKKDLFQGPSKSGSFSRRHSQFLYCNFRPVTVRYQSGIRLLNRRHLETCGKGCLASFSSLPVDQGFRLSAWRWHEISNAGIAVKTALVGWFEFRIKIMFSFLT